VVDDAMKESGQIGRELMRFSYFRLPFLTDEGRMNLRDIGSRLVSIEGTTMYADGGESERGVIGAGEGCAAALHAVLNTGR
jgi:hypothetical protein